MDVGSEMSFSHLVGQEKAKKLLGCSLSSGRMAHAYLFRGPDGVGKQLFARTAAAILNCQQNESGAACGRCSSCRKYQSGNHPDFLHIRPDKGSIKIARIRELKRELSYPPYESRMRVVLLEDIHTMRHEAANSLLKVLEEPPADNLLILTAESSKNILSTISSRCQTIPFYSLSDEETTTILLEKESGLDDKTAILLTRLSEGSPGRALLLRQSDMIETWEKVIDLLSHLHRDVDIGKVLKTAEAMAKLKDNLLPLFGLLRIWFRDLLVSSVGGDLTAGDGEEGDRSVPVSMKNWSSKELFAKMEAIDRAELELAHNCNRTLVCEILLFRLQ